MQQQTFHHMTLCNLKPKQKNAHSIWCWLYACTTQRGYGQKKKLTCKKSMIVRDVWYGNDGIGQSRDRMFVMNNANDDDVNGTMNSVYGSDTNTKYRMYAFWKRKILSKCMFPLLQFSNGSVPAENRCEFRLHSSLNCVRAPKYATWSTRISSSYNSCFNSSREHMFLFQFLSHSMENDYLRNRYKFNYFRCTFLCKPFFFIDINLIIFSISLG